MSDQRNDIWGTDEIGIDWKKVGMSQLGRFESAPSTHPNDFCACLTSEDVEKSLFLCDWRNRAMLCRRLTARSGTQAVLDFTPTADFPSLQYFDVVEKNSQADLAGLRSGDFLLQVGRSSCWGRSRSVPDHFGTTGLSVSVPVHFGTTRKAMSCSGPPPVPFRYHQFGTTWTTSVPSHRS